MNASVEHADPDLHLAPDTSCARRARVFLRSRCQDLGVGEDVTDTALLLGSELATNACLHARTDIVVCACRGQALRVEVSDGASQSLPPLRAADAWAETGRGLGIVDALASRWGVREDADGKTLWFELDLP